jgi:hypothetical protein
VDVVFYIEIGGGGGREGGTAHVGSFGEREHALSFARLIRNCGFRPRFVVGPLIAEHIRRAGFEPEVFWTPDEGVEIVRAIDPAMTVGCELFNLSPESAAGLMKVARSIGTIDGTSLSIPINTDPFEMPQYRRSLVLPEHYYAFRPCPVNDIGVNTSSVFHWSLFPDVSRVAKDPSVYSGLGLAPSRKTVMLPVAPWAMGSAAIFSLEDYYQHLVTRIVDGLDACGEPIELVFISLFRPASLTIEQRGQVTVHYPGLMEYDAYDHLLRSCDAIVTDNIISTSVSKAVVMGTPHLVIQNMTSSDLPYRFNMFPLKVLFPVEREYSQSVDTVEYGDPAAIRNALVAALQHGYVDADVRSRRIDYIERLRRLPEPGHILEQIIGRPEAAGRLA